MITLTRSKATMYGRRLWQHLGIIIQHGYFSLLLVRGEVPVFGSLIITAALTSFLILPVTSVWSRSRVFASFGLFVSLSFSSIMWAYVCIKQQVPRYGGDNFALMHTVVGAEPAVLCHLHAISGHQEWVFRLCSLIAGVLIAVG